MARRSLKEQQQHLIEGYKEVRVRRSIWYRIISVLSAITVFCTTYALILPALTQEDPTVGVKLVRDFYYATDDVTIVFSVSGRAVFKDENVVIDNPQAELVELEVVELAGGNDVYEQFSEHLEKGIGQEDLAQMLALELKFSYLGHELDTKRCDITAQIQAKEEFFTDEIGDIPQKQEPEANHPMSEPSYTSEPAMALTAIQGTGTNVFDAPTVYTTNVQEAAVLTVDVKGSYLALATSETENPLYNVQYYAKIPTIDNTPQNGGTHSVEVINTAGKGVPTNGIDLSDEGYMMNYYLKETGSGTGKYKFVEIDVVKKIYADIENVEYAKAPSPLHLEELHSKNSLYELAEIWCLKPDCEPESTNPADWKILNLQELSDEELFNYRFTNNPSANAGNKIYVFNGAMIRLVFRPKDQEQVSQDLTMYDYDISDGVLHTTTDLDSYETKASIADNISNQIENSPVYMRTYGDTVKHTNNYKGINSVATVGEGLNRFAFGNNNTGTGLGNEYWKSKYYLNQINESKGLFGLVTGMNNVDGDYVPKFDTDIIVPDLFTKNNEHDSVYNVSNTTGSFISTLYTTNLIANYDASNNVNTGTVDKESTIWKDLSDNQTDITVTKDANNYFTDDAYRISNTKVELPASIGQSALSKGVFTLEIEFGDIRDTGEDIILFSSGDKYFCLSIEQGKLCFYRNKKNLMLPEYFKNRTDDISCDKQNGFELVSYSTIAIRYTNDGSGFASNTQLEILCDGAIIFRNRKLDEEFCEVSGKSFYIGSDGTATNKHTTEYRSIRVYSTNLDFSTIKRNARYNLSRSAIANKNTTWELDTGGKNVIGGRDIVFNRVGDTYVLSEINNTVGVNLGKLTDLDYFNLRSNIMTNDFWPMDKSWTFGGDGNDIKFGSETYKSYRKFYGGTISTATELPVSIDSQDHNSYFGFKHKFDFYVDPDYCGPLDFFFYGDDDVWVFLDDDNSDTEPVLVCDLGGVHNPIGEYVDLNDYKGQNLDEDGNFSLYVFYLERGGSQSTAYMRFTLPTESITQLDIQETWAQLEISNTVNNIDQPKPFNYSIMLYDEAGEILHGIYPYKIYDETYMENDGVVKSGTFNFEDYSSAELIMQLGDKQKIVIYNLPLGTQYYISQKTRHGFYTSYTINDNEVIKGNVDRYGNVTEEDTVLSGVLVDNKLVDVDFYNTNYAELPSTGFNGENSVFMYYVPFGIATVYMCAMPFINRTKKSKKNDAEPEQA